MISVYEGSILDVDADVIVNPANSFLNHGGGLARVIHENALGSLMATAFDDWEGDLSDNYESTWNYMLELSRSYKTWTENAPMIPTGSALIGPAGVLSKRFKAIIHAVGPIWGGGLCLEASLERFAYYSAIENTDDAGYKSIAFPAISAGIFGVPIDIVATEAIKAAKIYQTVDDRMDFTFALMGEEHVAAFKAAAERYGVDLSEPKTR